MRIYETFETDSHILKVYYDDCPENPRERDNLGTMAGFSARYTLGDKHNYYNYRHFLECKAVECGYQGWVENASDKTLVAFLEKHLIILPYDLVGRDALALANTWDYDRDGFLRHDGFLYVAKKDVRKEYSVKRVTPQVRKLAVSCLKAEFTAYEQWRQGEVFGFQLFDKHAAGGEGAAIDACWGFYGDNFQENGLFDYLPEAIRNTVA